jgi:squalene-associated FAD-dependent desaturase
MDHHVSRTAVIGGGYAGMAAAVELADAGKPVTVFEAAKELGGRARRVTLGGVALDNGQHILLGAYRETLALIERVHPDASHAMLRQPLSIFIAGEFRLAAARLPAPFGLLLGFARARGLGIGERFAAAAFMLRMRLRGFRLPEDTTVNALLREARQGERSVRLLWEPLCVSALNTNIADASAQVFLNVLNDGLLGISGDSDMVIPREDLTSLFPAPAAGYVAARGGNVVAGTTIRDIVAIPGGYCLGGDPTAACYDNIIIAVSPHRLAPLIAAVPALATLAAMVERFDYEPISTCYLQYPEAVTLPEPMTGMPQGNGRIGQWAFDRGALSGHQGLVAIVVSASGPQQSLAQDELAVRLNAELAAIVPGLPEPAWSRVITEKRATTSCRPGMARPAVRTAMPGIFLAGDYLESRYPATLEAAVRSGREAARCVLAGRS